MPEEIESSALANRIRRLPGQIALAIVNATAILVIAAAVITIVALNYLENTSAAISESMTDAVLSSFDIDADQMMRSVEAFNAEIRDLRISLDEGRTERTDQLRLQIAGLTRSLNSLEKGVDELTEAKTHLTDAAIREVGRTLTDSLLHLRNCQPTTAPRSTVRHSEILSSRKHI